MLRANSNRNINWIRGRSKGKFRRESTKIAVKEVNKITNLKSFDFIYNLREL